MKTPQELIEKIDQVKEGNQNAFADVYKESYKYLHTCVIHIVKKEDIAQDMLQDTYVEILRNLGQLKSSGDFLSWAATIANRKCFAQIRKNKDVLLRTQKNEEGNENDFFESVADDEAFIPENIFDNRSKIEIVRSIIDDLSDVQRACVIGFYYNEQKQEEIASQLGIPVNTVKSHLNRAKSKIKASVADVEKKQGVKPYCVAPFMLLLFGYETRAYAATAAVPDMPAVLRTQIAGIPSAASAAVAAKAGTAWVKWVIIAAVAGVFLLAGVGGVVSAVIYQRFVADRKIEAEQQEEEEQVIDKADAEAFRNAVDTDTEEDGETEVEEDGKMDAEEAFHAYTSDLTFIRGSRVPFVSTYDDDYTSDLSGQPTGYIESATADFDGDGEKELLLGEIIGEGEVGFTMFEYDGEVKPVAHYKTFGMIFTSDGSETFAFLYGFDDRICIGVRTQSSVYLIGDGEDIYVDFIKYDGHEFIEMGTNQYAGSDMYDDFGFADTLNACGVHTEMEDGEEEILTATGGMQFFRTKTLTYDHKYIDSNNEGQGLIAPMWQYKIEKYDGAKSLDEVRESNQIFFPDASWRQLQEIDLAGMSGEELRRARNEIVALHGRRFDDPELQQYFDSKSWYYGYIEPDDFNAAVELNDVERYNMDFIKRYE